MFPLNCIEITFGRPKISQQTALAIGGIYGTKMTSWYDGIPPCAMPSCEKRSRRHLWSYVKTSAIDTTLVNTTSECSDQLARQINTQDRCPLYHHSLSSCCR